MTQEEFEAIYEEVSLVGGPLGGYKEIVRKGVSVVAFWSDKAFPKQVYRRSKNADHEFEFWYTLEEKQISYV
jgi:hypothetical protein